MGRLLGLACVLALVVALPARAHFPPSTYERSQPVADWVLGLGPQPGWLSRPVTQRADAASGNVKLVANLPELRTAIAINFIDDVMFVSTMTGLFSYDVSDPAKPSLLGALPQYIWENEDMEVDPKRKLVFIARDPRGIAGTTELPFGLVQIIDASNPSAMRQVGQVQLPSGHTTECINDCRFLWTGGPAASSQQPEDWGGRPIFAADITDPANPVVCPEPINVGANDGRTDYAHDTWVDADGVAWVASRGGIRGFWTSGRHRNPLTGAEEEATACKPIPYGGGASPEDATPSRFMHNSWRPLEILLGGERGRVIVGTEENIVSDCGSAGRVATYDLKGTLDGEGFKNPTLPMRVLDVWTTENQEGSTGCASAHWFADRGDGILAYAFYEQGLRFLDVSDPTDIRQVGLWRPDDADTWAGYFYKGYVFSADYGRGVDVLQFTGEPRVRPGNAGAPPPVPPGGDVCEDNRPPRSKLDRRRSALGRRGIDLRGRASDAPCRLSSGGTLPSRVERVLVAVAREKGKRCAWMRPSGRLRRAAPCRKVRWLPATGDRRWAFSKRVRLRRGTYRVLHRAIDANGIAERPRRARLRAR